MKTVYEKGINDTYRGWTTENEWNKKIHDRWCNILCRVYSEKYHDNQPTYINCTLCLEWHWLSKFAEDIIKINGYDEEKFLNGELELDKDIKSNGKIKEYSLENCMFVSKLENILQSNKTTDYSFLNNRIGNKHPSSISIIQYDENMNQLKIWECSYDVERVLGISNSDINRCCQFWEINCNKEEWFKNHKHRPQKTAGGFIWKYNKNK